MGVKKENFSQTDLNSSSPNVQINYQAIFGKGRRMSLIARYEIKWVPDIYSLSINILGW